MTNYITLQEIKEIKLDISNIKDSIRNLNRFDQVIINKLVELEYKLDSLTRVPSDTINPLTNNSANKSD
jgi:hypothetical protein